MAEIPTSIDDPRIYVSASRQGMRGEIIRLRNRFYQTNFASMILGVTAGGIEAYRNLDGSATDTEFKLFAVGMACLLPTVLGILANITTKQRSMENFLSDVESKLWYEGIGPDVQPQQNYSNKYLKGFLHHQEAQVQQMLNPRP